VELPLPDQGTTGEDDRFAKGHEIQFPIFGDEIRDGLADLPERLGEVLPRLLRDSRFGDFYTRRGAVPGAA